MMERLSGEPAQMWGPSIVGFGSYHYKYDSGHEGDMCRLGFSPRKAELVLYVLTDGAAEQEALLARLGKHKTGKCCLYIKKLRDVDEAVLEELTVERARPYEREISALRLPDPAVIQRNDPQFIQRFSFAEAETRHASSARRPRRKALASCYKCGMLHG